LCGLCPCSTWCKHEKECPMGLPPRKDEPVVPRTDGNDWLDEARMIAAQCWCDDETKDRVMDPPLAEAVARRIAAWMQTGAQHAQNEDYWRKRALAAEAGKEPSEAVRLAKEYLRRYPDEDGEPANANAIIAHELVRLSESPYVPAPSALEKLAIAVLDASREDFTDVDGGWLQDTAYQLGVLVSVNVTEPCGACVEYHGEFPCECYRYSDEAQAKRTDIQGDSDG
jgi:hypothetical protein